MRHEYFFQRRAFFIGENRRRNFARPALYCRNIVCVHIEIEKKISASVARLAPCQTAVFRLRIFRQFDFSELFYASAIDGESCRFYLLRRAENFRAEEIVVVGVQKARAFCEKSPLLGGDCSAANFAVFVGCHAENVRHKQGVYFICRQKPHKTFLYAARHKKSLAVHFRFGGSAKFRVGNLLPFAVGEKDAFGFFVPIFNAFRFKRKV